MIEKNNKIEEIHIRTLELISLHNYTSVIAKVLNVSRNEFRKILDKLELNKLIRNCGRNWLDKYSADRYEITPKGEGLLSEEYRSYKKMSGGVYDYLYTVIWDNPLELASEKNIEKLSKMLYFCKKNNRLEAANKIKEFISYMKKIKVDSKAEEIKDLLKAIEWVASGDSNLEAIDEEIKIMDNKK